MSTKSAFAFEQLVISDKPLALTPSIYIDAQRAFLTCEGEVRWMCHGEDPSAAMGHLMSHGACIVLEGELQIKRFRVISAGTNPAVISVSYEKE